MSRLTRRVRTDVSPMILKMLNLEETPEECIEVVGTDSKTCDEVCEENQCSTCVLSAVFEKLAHYEDLEEQGRLIELPCEKVYRIINYDSPKYAFIDSIPIEMMPIYDLKHIDNGNIFFSTKEKAEAKLEEVKGK